MQLYQSQTWGPTFLMNTLFNISICAMVKLPGDRIALKPMEPSNLTPVTRNSRNPQIYESGDKQCAFLYEKIENPLNSKKKSM